MKKLLLVISIIIAVLVAGVLLLPKLVPMETIATKAKEQVKQVTGRDLNFTNAKFVFWPNLGAELSDVTLGNAAWGKETNMLTLGKVNIALAVKPLLQRQIEIKEFILDAPVINLEVGADGKKNWDFPKADTAAPADASAAAESGPSMGGFGFKFGQFKITNGTMNYADAQKGTKVTLEAMDMAASFPDLASALQLDGALTYKGKRLNLAVNLETPMEMVKGKSSTGHVDVKTDESNVKLAGVLATQGQVFNGTVEANVTSLSSLLTWLNDGKAQTPVFEKVAFNSAATATITDVVLKGASLTLDEVQAKGDVNVGFAGKPEIFARLSMNKLNLDRFTATKAGATAVDTQAATKDAGWDTTRINFAPLKALNADLELKTEGFSVKGTDVGASMLTVVLQGGTLNFKSSEASLFDGKFSSDLTVNATPAVPTMAFNFKMKGVEAKPVLTNFADFTKLSGNVDADISVTTSGTSQKSLITALNGGGNVTFKKGTLEGIDLLTIANLIQKKQMNIGLEGKTEFTDLAGTFKIVRGVVVNNDLKMRSPLLTATGKGTIDLPQKRVSYRVTPTLPAVAKADGSEAAPPLAIPVDIKGPFASIKVTPDYTAIVTDVIKDPKAALENIKGQGQAIQENIKSIAKDPVGAIQNLFGGQGLFGAAKPAEGTDGAEGETTSEPVPDMAPGPAPTAPATTPSAVQ